MNIKTVSLLVASALALVACGGGGGGSGTSPLRIDSAELRTPEAKEIIANLGGEESPIVQAVDDKTPEQVVSDMAKDTLTTEGLKDVAVDLGDTKKVTISVGDLADAATPGVLEQPITSSSSKLDILKVAKQVVTPKAVEDQVVRVTGENNNYAQKQYRAYAGEYFTLKAYRGADAYLADGTKIGGDAGTKFKFDDEYGLIGNTEGTLAAVQSKTGAVTYQGKAFNAESKDGVFNYTVTFGAGASGEGKVTGLGADIALEKAALQDIRIQGKASGGVTGVYTVNLYGPKAQEAAGYIKSESGKSLVGFGGVAQ